MKHVKLFEDFDPFQFIENPEAELQKQESNPEIQEGDYVDTYRGKGRVISIDGDFSRIQLTDLSKAVIKVPTEMMKKIKKADVLPDSPKIIDELRTILDAAKNYNNSIEDTELVNNADALIGFLEETLTDVISLHKADRSIVRTEEYDELISEVARLVYIAQESAPEMKDRLDSIISAFSKIA